MGLQSPYPQFESGRRLQRNERPARQAAFISRADMAQLVEHHLAKVGVAGSNPVVRSMNLEGSANSRPFLFISTCRCLRVAFASSGYAAFALRSRVLDMPPSRCVREPHSMPSPSRCVRGPRLSSGEEPTRPPRPIGRWSTMEARRLLMLATCRSHHRMESELGNYPPHSPRARPRVCSRDASHQCAWLSHGERQELP